MPRVKVYCDNDCFNCPYPDCIQPLNEVTGAEKRLSKRLDDEVIGEQGKSRKMYKRTYNREHYHGLRRNKKVKRIGDGEEVIYKGVSEAAKSVGGFPPPVTECCKGRRKTYYGYRWEYV
jgi:hypothetical protein